MAPSLGRNFPIPGSYCAGFRRKRDLLATGQDKEGDPKRCGDCPRTLNLALSYD